MRVPMEICVLLWFILDPSAASTRAAEVVNSTPEGLFFSAIWSAVLRFAGIKMGQDEKLVQGGLHRIPPRQKKRRGTLQNASVY